MVGSLLFFAWLAAASTPGAAPAPAWGGLAPSGDGPLTAAGVRLLAAHVDGGIDAELRWADFGDLRSDLRRFYAARAWSPAWLRGGRPTPQAWYLAAVLAAADEKGLEPADYGAPWEARFAALAGGTASEAERVRLEVALTASALRYAEDLALGRIRPSPGSELLGRIQVARDAAPVPDLAEVVEAAAQAAAPGAVLAQLEPAWPAYTRALKAFGRLRAAAARPEPAPLPAPDGEPVAPERYAAVDRLAERLQQLGDLDAGALPAPPGAEAAAACTSPLAAALAGFQARHGLDATGFVDEATVRQLNVPLARRAAQLALSLERWRWLSRRFPSPPLVVNVPEFRLWDADGGPPISMRVVVGQAYRWGTPLFASELNLVIFRPDWNVPLGIVQRELLAKIEADRGLLAAAGLEVLDAGSAVVPPVSTPELLQGLASGALRLRQPPGAENALGLVKFVFANDGWIYLHDTPATELFARSRRDFSHGCIRVEDPVALAEWVLRDDPRWTREAIRAAMAAPRTLEVPVPVPVPVVVGYFTASVSADGELRFFEDIYGQDAALALALGEEAVRRGAR